MQVSVLQDQLAKAISVVSKAIDSRPTLPVLANVLIQTEDARLKIAATNLEMSIVTYIGARVDRPGAITLPAKTLAELVNNLSPERVDLTLDPATQTVNIRCGTTKTHIKGLAATEFPPLPELDLDNDWAFHIQRDQFAEMWAQVGHTPAREESRPILTGVCVKTTSPTEPLLFAAADGYRLAIKTIQCEHRLTAGEYVIPAKAMAEVARVCVADDGITAGITKGLAAFRSGSTTLMVQLLEGKFPDFNSIIPKQWNTRATVYVSDAVSIIKRAEIFARDSNFSTRIYVKPSPGVHAPSEMTILGQSAERGDCEGTMDATVDGDELEAAYNCRYLIDVIANIGTERVVFETIGAAHPLLLYPEGNGNYVAVVMPMSLNR